MIAPLRQSELSKPTPRSRVHRARRLVAESLLQPQLPASPKEPQVVAWKAWTLAMWAVGVLAATVWSLIAW